MKKTDGASRLDSLLGLWEDLCFIQKIGAEVSLKRGKLPLNPLDGPLTHAPEFRKFIMRFNGTFSPDDYLKFMYADMGSNLSIPLAILAWNHHSRRIFHLPTDIQTILDSTSLGGITWEEIKFPFDSFLITLEDPIISDENVEFDCILVSQIDSFIQPKKNEPIIEIRIISKNFSEYKKFSNSERKRVDTLVHNGQYLEILSWFKNMPSRNFFKTPAIHIFPDKIKEKTIRDSIPILGKLTGQPDMVKDSAMDSALHIVLNLCLYLENFSSNTLVRESRRFESMRKEKDATFDPDSIQKTADIFTVKCAFKMTRSEIDQIVKEEKEAKERKEAKVHWRRAHWRRKPGCGHIPMKIAPKDWISRKLINAERLPPNSLPPGTKATVTK